MSVYEKERPFKSFVLPNESFKWDFILDECVTEDDARREAAAKRRETQRADEGFDKDYIVTRQRRKLHDRYYY